MQKLKVRVVGSIMILMGWGKSQFLGVHDFERKMMNYTSEKKYEKRVHSCEV